jgi:hypothetical protein
MRDLSVEGYSPARDSAGGTVVDRARKAWNEDTPDSFKATLGVFAWALAGIILLLS